MKPALRQAVPAGLARTGRFAALFERCRAERRPALITYLMAGDPELGTSLRFARACLEGGADALELGVPFSDPSADGPVIQRAGERALAAGTTVSGCLELARAVRRDSEAPLAVMSYLNPLLSLGEAGLATRCKRSGVDALIVPDLPAEESSLLAAPLRAAGVGLVSFLSPVSPPSRVAAAAEAASAFVYFVAVTGVTGARKALPEELPAQLRGVREQTGAPVAVGFGVSTPAQARALAPLADGVIVGSAIVRVIADPKLSVSRRERQLVRLVRSLRNALSPRGS